MSAWLGIITSISLELLEWLGLLPGAGTLRANYTEMRVSDVHSVSSWVASRR